MAKACGKRVEVESARTETLQVFANADGTSTLEQYAYPQRARMANGTWSALDPTLVANVDGSLSPRASTVSMTFSGGGAGELVRARRSGGEVTLSWPKALPKPTVAGSVATYAEVLAGVDLVLTAQGTGFSEVLVVKDRKAALNPALREIAFGNSLTGLRWDGQNADLKAVDASGKVVLGASGPRMWDSAGNGVSKADGPAEGARTAPIGVSVQDKQLTLAPDLGLLTDPAAEFPVFIDPTIGYSSWTMMNEYAPDQSYWSYDRRNCTGPHNTECAKVGYYSDPVRYRSLFEFSTDSYRGKQVLGAVFSIDLLHSASCGDSWTELRVVDTALHPGTTWRNTIGAWAGTNASAVWNSSCGSARKLSEFEVTGVLQQASQGWVRTTFGLMAGDESNTSGWKKFDATTAKVIATVNTPPNPPSQLTVDGKACATGDGRPFVSTPTPTMRAVLNDPDGNSMTASFDWERIRFNGTRGNRSAALTQGSIPSGTTAMVTAPAGVLDKDDELVATGDWNRDGKGDVFIRENGYLYVLVGNGTTVRSRVNVGLGWHPNYWTIAGIADWDRDGFPDIVARFNNGDLYVWPGADTPSGLLGNYLLIGTGWNGFTFAGLADWDRDGHMDIIATDAGNTLWLYPGESKRNGGSLQPRVQLDWGWGGYTFFGTIDWDRDGAPDVVARDPSGLLWLYPGSGGRAPYSGSPNRFNIDNGWGGYTAFTMRDLNGDGSADIAADPPGANYFRGYPGSGGRVAGPSPWLMATTGMSNDGTYAFHASAADTHATTESQGWCEFTVDMTKPVVPTVTADIYKEGTDVCNGGACGSVGETGKFAFLSSPDVASFKWGFSDPPSDVVTPPALGAAVSVAWTPTSGGAKILYVTAVDRAGNESRKLYQFVVGSPSIAAARWKLDDAAGSGTLVDDTGNGRTLTVSGGATLGTPGRIVAGPDGASRTAITFDGVNDYASRSDFLDTSKSFSFSAWTKLNAKGTTDQAVVNHHGSYYGAFYLLYVAATDRWTVAVASSPEQNSSPTWWLATATSVPQVGIWTHLAGTYDSATKTLRIYVNGALEGTTTGVTTFDAAGPVQVGRGGGGFYLNGSVSEVQLWNRMIVDSEVFDLANPFKVGSVAEYHFEEVGPGPAYDSSGMAHDLTFFGGAHVPPNGAGHSGAGLRVDGIDDYAAPDGQVLRTDQSFTVAAWVRLSDTTRIQGFLAQRSTGPNPGFMLLYDPAGGGNWIFVMRASATATTGATQAVVPATSLTDYHHLVGVFDAQKRQVRLYVDGTQKSVVPMNAAWQPWDATGRLVIGTGQTTFVKGDLDEVRVYQGAASDVTPITGGTNVLTVGKKLTAGQFLRSNVNRHELIMQSDGNLVHYEAGVARWSTNTHGNPGAYVVMQTDGNLVVYSSTGVALWNTRTGGTAANLLAMQDDGNVVLYGPNGQVFWHKFQ